MELPAPALFTALNRDTMELHAELVPFDAHLAQEMSDRAVAVVRASEAGEWLPRAAAEPTAVLCRGGMAAGKWHAPCAWAGTVLGRAAMIPDAYELKRIVRAHRDQFWCSDLLGAAEFAPIYFFDDQAAFDGDSVDRAMTRILYRSASAAASLRDLRGARAARGPLGPDRLRPCRRRHRRGHFPHAQAGAARLDGLPRADLDASGRQGGDRGQPCRATSDETVRGHGEVAAGIVWRALTILSAFPEIRDRKVSLAKRSRLVP
jgi:hypothetical protein